MNDFDSLERLAHLQATTGKHCVELLVKPAACVGEHSLVELERAVEATVVEARLHEASIHLDIRAEAILLTEVFHHLGSLVQTFIVPLFDGI